MFAYLNQMLPVRVILVFTILKNKSVKLSLALFFG